MPFLRLFLLPIALFYGLVVFFRNMFFDYGIFSSKEYSVPIISVGNLCAGGSGKSPLVEYILRLIDNRDKVAVLSRGYGRDSTGFQWVTNKSFVKTLNVKNNTVNKNDIVIKILTKNFKKINYQIEKLKF